MRLVDRIQIEDLEIHLDRYEVYRDGVRIRLTGKEFEILALLASSPGEVFTREEILSYLWGTQSVEKDITTITVLIRKIRKKIETVAAEPKYIQTVWGVGYKFCDADSEKVYKVEKGCPLKKSPLKIENAPEREMVTAEIVAETEDPNVIRVGGMLIYINRYEVYCNHRRIPMTSKEFEILSLMASSPGEVFTREEILSFLWGKDCLQKDMNTVTVFVRKIREKIEVDPSAPQYIQTVRRVGYKFCGTNA